MWLAALLACGSPPADPPPVTAPPVAPSPAAPPPATPDDPLHDCVERAIDVEYGPDGMGMADNRPDATVGFVSLHRKADHVVYITHGVIKHAFPHEFVLRLRDPAATSSRPLIEVAPMWPVTLLREVAEAEARRGKVFRPRDLLGNITLPGVDLPYRNTVFVMDPLLQGVQCADTFVGFVQLVLFNDADWTAMQAIPDGEPNTVWKARMEADPLGMP